MRLFEAVLTKVLHALPDGYLLALSPAFYRDNSRRYLNSL
jgi:hypothetical protein